MIPATVNRKHFFQIARHYHIRYLVMDVAQRPMAAVQKQLERLVEDPEHPFRLVYTSPDYLRGKTNIYEFPADYGAVEQLQP